MYILGIWDGHDSGAALIHGKKILFAANEERYTKRKLEVAFPSNSISAALSFAGLKPNDVDVVAFPTADVVKTMERIYPYMKESYYRFRRRKQLRPMFATQRHALKYGLSSFGRGMFSEAISKALVARRLHHMGFRNPRVVAVDHHAAHAIAASSTSGFSNAAVVTLDGLGDGLSGSINLLRKGRLERVKSIPARESLGIFYEQVTNILGMRELEDEGKIMAMADYSYPFSYAENKLAKFFEVDGTTIKARYGPFAQYDALSRMAWSMPREQFAYMAQQVLETALLKFFSGVIEDTGVHNIAYSGGVASNVKANMKIRDMDAVKGFYIFPHMGDGGIALGAAMQANAEINNIHD